MKKEKRNIRNEDVDVDNDDEKEETKCQNLYKNYSKFEIN